ncbi:MAG TPA: efflux RND transporter periplasmic adaptor subunit, partial [Thermoanaerobaculia bacterium]
GAGAELERARRAREQLLARRDEMHAALAQADAYVSETRIRAPFDGVVTARYVDPGAQTAPGMPLLAIDSGTGLRVETTVDEEWIGRLRRGDFATIRFADGSTTRAALTAIVAAVDPLSRAGLVKIDLPADASVPSGTYASVAFEIGHRSAIAVPSTAIVRRGQLTSVFVVDGENVARLRLITISEVLGDRVEVLSGLDQGERIVSRATNDLRDGTLVRAVLSVAGGSR